MIEYIEISGIKTIVRLPDNYLCGRKYKVIFINDGEIVNNIEQPDNQIYVGLIHKNRLAAYTPWPYKAIREGAEDFGGECREYHNQLVGEIVPYISKHYNVYAESMAYGGYSLGGLAAIYSLYFDETFSTIFSVCGSFWYPGFADYVVNNNVKNRNAAVYLLNGEQEGVNHGNLLEQAPVKAHMVHEHLMSVMNAVSIATASPRVTSISFGAEDFTRTLGAERTKEGKEIFMARSLVVMAAAIAGVDAIDTVWSDLDDEEGFRNEVKTSANMGFAGKSCIHPSQVKIVHEIFTPTKEELEKSLEIVKAAEAADISKGGVITVNGKMVDIPVIAKAEKVVRLAKSAGMIK